MKRYLLIVLLLLIPISVGAWGLLNQMGAGSGGGEPPATGQDYYVDFTEYDAADDHLDDGSGRQWTTLDGTATSVDITSDDIDGPGSEFSVVFDAESDTISQYVATKILMERAYNGLYFRSTGNSSEDAYALRPNDTTTAMWRWCTGSSCTNIGSCTTDSTMVENASFGARVTGTGTSTKVEVWSWSGASPPRVTDGDVNTAWGAPDCTICASGCDTTWTAPTGHYADTGKQGGLYNGGSDAQTFDDFAFGDSTN